MLKNVKGWCQGFFFGRFLRIFRDVVMIICCFGVGYFWIDSFCIIQDDKSDWECEFSKMVSIYQNFFFILVVIGFVDGDCGCFVGFYEIFYYWFG